MSVFAFYIMHITFLKKNCGDIFYRVMYDKVSINGGVYSFNFSMVAKCVGIFTYPIILFHISPYFPESQAIEKTTLIL